MINGRDQAISEAFKCYERMVYRAAYNIVKNPEDAQDVVVETFERAFSGYDGYEEGTSMSSWLHKIAANTAIGFKRKRERRRTSPLEEDHPCAGFGGVDDKILSGIVSKDLIEEIKESLPEYQISTVVLRAKNLTYGEISEQLGIPVGTVRSRLSRARDILNSTPLEGLAV